VVEFPCSKHKVEFKVQVLLRERLRLREVSLRMNELGSNIVLKQTKPQ
jgi:hypothetical protein